MSKRGRWSPEPILVAELYTVQRAALDQTIPTKFYKGGNKTSGGDSAVLDKYKEGADAITQVLARVCVALSFTIHLR